MRQLVALVLGSALVLAACGDDDGGSSLSANEQALADLIAAEIIDDDEGDGPPLSSDQAQCIGDRSVAAVGFDRLVEVGLGPDALEGGTSLEDVDLPDAEVDAIVDVYFECVDVKAIFTQGMLESGEVSQDSAECVADGIDERFVRTALEQGIRGEDSSLEDDPELLQSLLRVMTECLTAEELAEISG